MAVSIDDDDEAGQGSGKKAGESDYEVGYGKPPAEHKFQKGNKQGGRKKGSKGIRTLVNEAFDAKAPAKLHGKTQKVSKKALAMHQLANKASAGDMKAIEKAIPLLERYGPQEDANGPTVKELRPDIETLRNYLAWYDLRNPPDSDNEDDPDDSEDEVDHG